MRVTGFWTAVGAVIAGLILAGLVKNYQGTKVISNGIISLEKNTGNQLLGQPAK